MTITSELLGRLGGGVEREPVSIPETGDSTVIKEFNFPEGQTYLVGVTGTSAKYPSSTTSYPQMEVGGTTVYPRSPRNPWGVAGTVSGNAKILFLPRGGGILSASFEGEVFWARVN